MLLISQVPHHFRIGSQTVRSYSKPSQRWGKFFNHLFFNLIEFNLNLFAMY